MGRDWLGSLKDWRLDLVLQRRLGDALGAGDVDLQGKLEVAHGAADRHENTPVDVGDFAGRDAASAIPAGLQKWLSFVNSEGAFRTRN